MFDDALEAKLHAKGAHDYPSTDRFVAKYKNGPVTFKYDIDLSDNSATVQEVSVDTAEFTPIFETEEVETGVFEPTGESTPPPLEIDYVKLTEQIHEERPVFKPGDCPIYDAIIESTHIDDYTGYDPERHSIALENRIGETIEWAASQIRSMWNVVDSHSYWSIQANN